ncbi:MAG: VOC family protein [Chthonomonas sp.]|nr:VOC family protein [Chthonomonas sp.]
MFRTHFTLYVQDQSRSSASYERVLGMQPRLDVPGMTEFEFGDECVLGLMPSSGIKRLLGEKLPDPVLAAGIPRAELYSVHPNADQIHRASLDAGGRELSPMTPRDWGDTVAYSLDLDGHVLAFARPTSPTL